MSSQTWRLGAGATVLAAPFGLFFILLAIDPVSAGLFAGSLLARITDPPILVGIFLAGVAGTARRHFGWALGIGVLIGAAGSLLGYGWWSRVAGSAAAVDMVAHFVVWAILLAAYGYVGGRVLIETRERPVKTGDRAPENALVNRPHGSSGANEIGSNSAISPSVVSAPAAEYYPLISRAVAALGASTKESRAAVYERARAAQQNELRKRDPPLSDSEIQRERLALENAIRTVEIDVAINRAMRPKVPQLPFEATAAVARMRGTDEMLAGGVQQIARRAGYAMPNAEAATIVEKLVKATPEVAQDMLRELQVSPRQVASRPQTPVAAAPPKTKPQPPSTTSPTTVQKGRINWSAFADKVWPYVAMFTIFLPLTVIVAPVFLMSWIMAHEERKRTRVTHEREYDPFD